MSDFKNKTPRTLDATFNTLDNVLLSYGDINFVRFLGSAVAGYDILPNSHTRIYDIISNLVMSDFDDGSAGVEYTDDGKMYFTPEATEQIVQEVLGSGRYKIDRLDFDQSQKSAKMLADYTSKIGTQKIAVEGGINPGGPKFEPLDRDGLLELKAIFNDNF